MRGGESDYFLLRTKKTAAIMIIITAITILSRSSGSKPEVCV